MSLEKINHFVVLMLENRSFDHMLGFLYEKENNLSPLGHPFEGLTGKEKNPDAAGNPVPVFKIQKSMQNAYFMPGADPGEGYFNTNEQLFSDHLSQSTGQGKTNDGFLKNFAYTLQWEEKSQWSILPGTEASHIMGIYTPEMLPILSNLAKGYAVCDHWYCSAPTETLPNRALAVMGTSQGRLTDKDKVYTAKSIFKHLQESGHSWSIYGYSEGPLSRASYADITHASNSHFGQFNDFKDAAANGTLANYTFLEPQWGKGGNSQHPNYDVSKGEALIQEVYDTLRKSPNWENTLLVITYDEHGGCFDHVQPPSNATPPDDCVGQYNFDFTRFGVRVPTLLISPYIEAGTVFRSPEGGAPFDHTSILKTLETRFGLTPLSKRDAAAPDFSRVFTLSKPRTDDPLKGIDAPTHEQHIDFDDEADHLQKLYTESMEALPVEEARRIRYSPADWSNGDHSQTLEYGKRRYHDYFQQSASQQSD